MASGETPATWPKILLAKPASSRAGGGTEAPQSGSVKLMRDRDDEKVRFPQGSLNLLTDSWDFNPERLLPLMSDNTDFTVVGVLGLPGAGKSSIMNELYGFDGTTTIPGVLPPFPVLTDELKVMARHCTTGMELRVSSERFILLDTQPLWSASVLMDLTRPDGSSTVQLLPGETITAELALELMAIQMGVFLASVCHVLIVVTDGVQDTGLWQLLQTVEMLKHGIPDPSVVSQFQVSTDELPLQEPTPNFFADPVFVHTKLRDSDLSVPNLERLKLAFEKYFKKSTFRKNGAVGYSPPQHGATKNGKDHKNGSTDELVNFFVLPRLRGEVSTKQFESYENLLHQLRDQILSMPRRPFAKTLNERDWLRNAARVWDLVKKSPVIADYGKMLQNSVLFRR